MPSGGRRHRGRAMVPAAWGAIAFATAVALALMFTPAAQGAARLASRLAKAASSLSRHAPRAPASLRESPQFAGTPAVGALFTLGPAGQPGRHFCTASVVDSPVRDLVITAAHCVGRMSPSRLAFVPGYHDGQAPYGRWAVTHILVDQAWRGSANPNDDFAFLVVQPASGTPHVPIQQVTGGESLGVGFGPRAWVRVIGYPGQTDRPITCVARTRPFGPSQLRFDCGGFTDGTSGGPFLARYDRATHQGTVIGVIGGYQQGGDVADISYSARFTGAVYTLYQAAVAAG